MWVAEHWSVLAAVITFASDSVAATEFPQVEEKSIPKGMSLPRSICEWYSQNSEIVSEKCGVPPGLTHPFRHSCVVR